MERDEEVVYLHLDDIIPNRFQPREVFEERPLKELAVSIKEHGVIQPIIVRKVNDKYEIIAGERRYKASALAGLTKIPAIVRDLDDKETSKVALLENLQRKNLNPVEEAKTYQKILELDEMTQEELAKTMGKSQSAVANKIRLLSLPEDIQEALLKEQISERHARSLLNLETPEEQKEMLKKIIDNKMTVRQLEEEIKGNSKEESDTIEEKKKEDEVLTIPKTEDIPSASSFVPVNPIMPNFDGENDDNNAPILTNIPDFDINNDSIEESDESDDEEKPKFINFGDIKKDDVNDDLEEESDEVEPIDIENLKENASDISISQNEDKGLDSLLNIGDAPILNNSNDSEPSFKFFSPAQEAINNSETKEEDDKEDYFKVPDLVSVDLPDTIKTDEDEINGMTLDDEVVSINNEDKPKNIMNEAINIIRDSIDKIEELGLKVDKDEMSLEKSYQVIIKIEK